MARLGPFKHLTKRIVCYAKQQIHYNYYNFALLVFALNPLTQLVLKYYLLNTKWLGVLKLAISIKNKMWIGILRLGFNVGWY